MTVPRDIRDIPSGKDVSLVFPWWNQGRWAPTAASQQGRFTTQPGDKSFKNELDGNIEIHEIRFVSFRMEVGVTAEYTDRSEHIRVQINTSRDNLIEQWIPVRCLGNRPHDVMSRPKIGTRVALPAPYFLQWAARFRMDLRLAPNMVAVAEIRGEVLSGAKVDVAIRGYDPDNKVPVVMAKQVTLPEELDEITPVSFDEEMDTALRHCVIDDISFGFIDPGTTIVGPGGPPLHLDVRFHPNTGPEWVETNSGWIRLAGINDPASMVFAPSGVRTYFPYTVHRPESPIVLKPKDELNVLVKREATVGYRGENEQHFCWVIGTQEVPHAG